MGRSIGFGDLARQRHHQRYRMFGGGDGIAEGCVHHDDAALGGGRDVDIVDADAGPADDLELAGRGDQLRRHFRRRADGEAVIGRNGGEERILVLAEIGLVVDIDAAVAEDLHRGFGEFVGDENTGSHGRLRKYEIGLKGLARRFRIGPVEPGDQRLDIGGFDSGAAPDAQARRRIAIGADIEGGAL